MKEQKSSSISEAISYSKQEFRELWVKHRFIPLLTKEQEFYFGFTIFPPNNKPYNFRCTLFSPDATKLSNETGEIIEKVASSTESKQQFRFPTRRAEGITTMPMWLDEGDPPGEYRIEIFVNEDEVYAVDFVVYESE